MVIDKTTLDKGYAKISVSFLNKKQKIRITKGKQTLYYDVIGTEITVPFQLGNGTYKISLFKNTSGNKYSLLSSQTVKINLKNPLSPFLYPNQYVDYKDTDEWVLAAAELRENTDDKEFLIKIKKYIKDYFKYDFIRAIKAKQILPNIKQCWEKKMGICQDLAALVASMLRSQGIAAKYVIGYANKTNYHSWVQVIIGNEEIIIDPTILVNGVSKITTYKIERFY